MEGKIQHLVHENSGNIVMNNEMKRFCVRIVSIESALCKPYSHIDICYSTFFNRPITCQVPIIRVYGSTPSGQVIRNFFKIDFYREHAFMFIMYFHIF